jgi:hypothetical protein
MQVTGIAIVCALAGIVASTWVEEPIVEVRASMPSPADDAPQCTTRSDCPWQHVCRWGVCEYVDCGGLSTCQKGTEELTCCSNGCSPSGGCAGDVPNPPSCPGYEVRCGSICCPYMYACLDPNTGTCGINM